MNTVKYSGQMPFLIQIIPVKVLQTSILDFALLYFGVWTPSPPFRSCRPSIPDCRFYTNVMVGKLCISACSGDFGEAKAHLSLYKRQEGQAC